jgi:uncharacterized membrane protein
MAVAVVTDPSPAEGAQPPSRPDTTFRVALWLARSLLVAQLAWLLGFSTVAYRRDSLTFDFATWNQAISQIAHGHLNPYSTLERMPFWQVNGTWLMWPIAPLSLLPTHGLVLLWIQDLAIFGCAWVVLNWVAEAATGSSGNHRQWRLMFHWTSPLSPAGAVILVAVLFVANPWVYWSAAFDFHWELPAAFFALLAAWDLCRGRTKRLWIWVALTLATSDVSSFYVIGVGLAGLLFCGKERRRISALIVATGFAWLAFMSVVQANRGSILTEAYAYLAGPGIHHASMGQIAWGAVSHPNRPLSQLWSNRVNFWANLSPNGLLGVASPWGFSVFLTVLIPAALWNGHAFSMPSYQNFPAYPFVVLGSVLLLGRLGAHVAWVRHAARPLALAMAGLAAAWAWAWLPIYPSTWLAVTPAGGRAIAEARIMIPANAEVVASNGVVGRFAGRAHIYMPLQYPFELPLRDQPVYFVLSTSQGYPYAQQDTEAVMAQVSSLDAHLLLENSGIWVFRWDPPTGQHSLVLRGATGGIAAWLYTSPVGVTETKGAPITWRIDDSGQAGVVLSGDHWNEVPGRYNATVGLAGQGSVTIQVWNLTTGKLLSTKSLAQNNQLEQVEVPFTLGQAPPQHLRSGLSGKGPLEVQSWPAAPGQILEVRVIDPGRSSVNVYTVGISPAKNP